MIGRTVSHYKILRTLGNGAMGVVYEARDLRLDRTVALKFLPQSATSDEVAKSRFVREARASSVLDHPNICTIYDIEETREGRVFIAMARYEGETLEARMARGPVPLGEAIEIVRQVGAALAKAHAEGIVHRDIKPANIFLTREGLVKVLDFGLAVLAGSARLTTSDAPQGTMAYMSPEQARGKGVDARTDIWSLGVLLYEMLAGGPPFQGDYNAALLYSILSTDPEPLGRLRPDLPEGLADVCHGALTKDPEARYPSVTAMLQDLECSMDAAVPAPRPRLLARPGAVLPLAFMLAAAIVTVAEFAGHRGGPHGPEVDRLLIMPFANVQDPEDENHLADIISALLITGMSGADRITVVSSQRLHDLLGQNGRGGMKVIDGAAAADVARAAGATWMLTGSILQTEPELVVTSQVVEVASGDVVGTHRISAVPGETVFIVVDRLARDLREDLSLPLAGGAAASVADVTTTSPEAYRHYVEGLEYNREGTITEAKRSFEQAVGHDSTFAMAYYALSEIDLPEPLVRARYLEMAVRYSGKVSELERLYISAHHAAETGRTDEAIESYESIVVRFPDEEKAYLCLGEHYLRAGDPERAIAMCRRVIDLDPLDWRAYRLLQQAFADLGKTRMETWAGRKVFALAPNHPRPYTDLAESHMRAGRTEDAIVAFRLALARDPDYWPAQCGLWQMLLHAGNDDAAIEVARDMLQSPEPSLRETGYLFMGLVHLYRGEFGRGLDVLDDGIASDHLAGHEEKQLADKLLARAIARLEVGQSGRAREDVDQYVDICTKVGECDDAGSNGSAIYARLGDFTAAERVLEEWRKSEGAAGTPPSRDVVLAQGRIALARGDVEAAIALLETDGWRTAGEWRWAHDLARARFAAGDWRGAIEAFRLAATIYDPTRINVGFVETVKDHYFLGYAHDMLREFDRAAEQYEAMIRIWRNADHEGPELRAARARLAELRQAARSSGR